ncbi:MAG: YceI family protein [Myxococcales bacterium]|jgi:polyisoprenoid-binding protein YceI
MMTFSHLTRFVFLVSALCLPCLADAKLVRTTDPAKVEFVALGPLGIQVNGHGSELSVGDDGTTVTVTIPLQSLSTDNGLRDRHMREALETSKYPNTVLTVARGDLKFPADGQSLSATAPGNLFLHGVTKPVQFTYDAQNAGGAIQTKGRMPVDMTLWGITPPSYAKIAVDRNVTVNVAFVAADR